MRDDVIFSPSFIEGRGDFFCRGCLGNNLFSALDLGELPIANELLKTSGGELEKYPLHLKICTTCGLGQVADVVTPERIFRDYRYLSSISTTFLQHASDYVDSRIQEGMFSREDWVLEIASNDGYLLKNFIPYGIATVGIEPAGNVAAVSSGLGIETISEFFSSKLASQLLSKYGFPKLIIANNVMAHVPDLIDIIQGLAILCGPETQISIENPSLSNILLGMQFDTIYHEHYSYLSTSAVSAIFKMQGLHLSKVEELRIHGGSNRYWLNRLAPDNFTDDSVERLIQFEITSGLFSATEWNDFSSKVNLVLEDFHDWLLPNGKAERRIYGYGAAAKASTILNSIDISEDLIIAIADASLEKQDRFMPPHGIKIISPEELISRNPTDILIFPWNIKSEIASFIRSNLGSGVRIWCAIPKMCQVNSE